MPFDYNIGEIPQGWERGDRLTVINAYFKFGRTMGMHRAFPAFSSEFSREIELRFDVTQAVKVLTWLRWWFEDYPNDYLDIERKIR